MLKEAESDSQVSPPASESNNKAFTPDTQSTPDTDIDTPGQRDSGYVTDLSPLSFRSTPRQFNFSSEAEDNVFELSQEIDALELEERVFPFESEANEDGGASGDTDVTDQAVENILTDYGELGASRAVSDPINITRTRPRAPAPLSLGSDDYLNQSSVSSNINSIDVEFTNLTPEKPKGLKCLSRNAADSSEDKYEFCLSSQRSVATQTPPSLLPEAACCQSLHRSEDLQLTKDQPFSSLQHQTEDVVMTRSSASLPDVVPFQRNRSVSLPEVQPLRQFDERTMGRTLRRISDEFEFYHRESRRQQRASSLPQSFDLWNALRRYFSSDLTDLDSNNDRPAHTDLHNFDGKK